MGGSTLDMTKGSPWKLITQFAVPVFLSQVFQQLYNTADALIVGRFLGDEALAAVSASGPLIFLLISFFTGLSMVLPGRISPAIAAEWVMPEQPMVSTRASSMTPFLMFRDSLQVPC